VPGGGKDGPGEAKKIPGGAAASPAPILSAPMNKVDLNALISNT